jgi:uncharacterized protein YjbJ (UPF0337 family)
MNKDQTEGRVKEAKGKAQAKFGDVKQHVRDASKRSR